MKSAWRLSKGMVVREIESNIFMFQFFTFVDKTHVMEEGLWTFDGAPLILKEVKEGIQPSELTFDTIRIWVKAEDVPLNKRTKSMAISMASNMGSFVEFDETDPIGWSKYMRFRVDLNLKKRLRRGMRIAVSNGSKWVKFKYEKLIDFCFACGLIGHSHQKCE
uniref:CCHC-type domain-containing protein n=1 Tax=Chenopodium quinoa TaxID=63459 RepID=A0A803MD25_CHEQI